MSGELFSDYEDALAKFKPDMVLICTPPVYHVDEALAALQAGAHVFIEKPLVARIDWSASAAGRSSPP